jgi:hypothetical protein
MEAGATAPWQGQMRDNEVSRRTERGTSLQGMLPAGNVATSKPISSRSFSSSEGVAAWRQWPGDALGIQPVLNCTLGYRQTELNKFLAEPNHASRMQRSLPSPLNPKK